MGEMVRHKILFPGRDCILVITHQCYLMLTSTLSVPDLIFSEVNNSFFFKHTHIKCCFLITGLPHPNNIFKLIECKIGWYQFHISAKWASL